MIRWMTNLSHEQLRSLNLFVIVFLFTGFFISTLLNPVILLYYKLFSSVPLSVTNEMPN